jgi:large subunit ribosomal protein L20
MTRVKKGVNALKSRRNILKQVKGYRFGRSKKERQANEAIMHAGQSAFAHRRDKKNDMRQLWTTRLSAALKPHNISYSKFISMLKKANVGLDRKVLAEIAATSPEAFDKIVKHVS